MCLQGLVIAPRGPVGEAEEIPRAGFRRQVGDRLFQQLDGLGVLARPQGFVALPQRLDAVRLGLGFGVFSRWGEFASPNFGENISVRLGFRVGL